MSSATVALLIGAIVWRVRRTSGSDGGTCCPPPPGQDQEPEVDQPSTRMQER
jgi:hypothetical protein